MLKLIACTANTCGCIHSIAAHSKVFFNNAYFSNRHVTYVNAYPKIRNYVIFIFEVAAFLLNIFSCLYNCVEAFACITGSKFPGAYHFITYILINSSIKFYYCLGYTVNKIAYKLKINSMAKFLGNWGRILKVHEHYNTGFHFWSNISSCNNIEENTGRIFFIDNKN